LDILKKNKSKRVQLDVKSLNEWKNKKASLQKSSNSQILGGVSTPVTQTISPRDDLASLSHEDNSGQRAVQPTQRRGLVTRTTPQQLTRSIGKVDTSGDTATVTPPVIPARDTFLPVSPQVVIAQQQQLRQQNTAVQQQQQQQQGVRKLSGQPRPQQQQPIRQPQHNTISRVDMDAALKLKEFLDKERKQLEEDREELRTRRRELWNKEEELEKGGRDMENKKKELQIREMKIKKSCIGFEKKEYKIIKQVALQMH